MQRLGIIGLSCILFLLFSTGLQAQIEPRSIKQNHAEQVSAQPYLVDHLPQELIAYLRIPNMLTFLGAPVGNVFDKAMASDAYVETLKSFKLSLADLLVEQSTTGDTLIQDLLFRYSLSPIEVAVIPSINPQSPVPGALMHMKMNFESVVAFNEYLQKASEHSELINLVMALNGEGSGMLQVRGLPFFIYFDEKTQHVFMLSGMGFVQGDLEKIVSGLTKSKKHSMYTVEQQFDTSRQGLFLWTDVQRVVLLMEKMGAMQQVEVMRAQGLDEAKSLAVGLGTAKDKQRLKVMLEMPRVGLRSYLYEVDTVLDIKAAGELKAVGVINLPSIEDVTRIEEHSLVLMDDDAKQRYLARHQEIAHELGFSLWDIFKAIGPELVVLSDDAGEYAMLRIRDKVKLNELLDGWEKHLGLQRNTRKIQGVTYTHIVVPSWLEDSETQQEKSSDPISKFTSLPSHFYWREEGEFLVIGNIPQVLMDRSYLEQHTKVGQWLNKNQSVSSQHALLLGSVKNEGLPRMIYSANLQLLLMLGDFLEQPIDLFAFPSAKEAFIPDAGAYSFKIDSSTEYLSAELSFEHNPLELLFAGGGYSAIVGVGVLAAVAVPAYQDYLVRAKVSQGYELVSPMQTAIAKHYLIQGSLPSLNQVAEMIPATLPSDIEAINYDDAENTIVVIFTLPALGEQRYLYISGMPKDGGIAWSCYGDMEQKYLPQACRD